MVDHDQAENLSIASETHYRNLFEHMLEGFAYCKMLYADERPVDFLYILVNPAFERLTGLKNVTGKKVSEVIPDVQITNPELFEIYGRVASLGQPEQFETYLASIDVIFSISVYSPVTGYFIAVFNNITEKRRAEDALRESEARFRSIYENTTIGLYRTTPSGKILLCNPALLEMLGYSSFGELASRDLEAEGYEPGYERLEFREQIERDGELRAFESNWTRKDGTGIYVLESAKAVRDVNGEVLYYEGTVEDITERKKAEEEIRKLNADLEKRVQERSAELLDLYNNAPCGYHSLDTDGLYVRINDTELDWLGYSREEVIGKMHFSDILTPASLLVFENNFPVFKERGWVDNLEFDLVRKDGSIISVLLSATAIRDPLGHFYMSRSTMIDHTLRKQAEEAMKQSKAQTEAVNKELEAFTYSVSHDLRAPLRAIDGFSRIIVEDYSEKLDAEGLRLLEIICSSAKKMDELITGLLTLSRVSRFELNNSRVDMASLARSTYDEIAPNEAQKDIIFSIAPLPVAYGDPLLLRQVWSNLLSNAIKYTRPKAERRIEISSYQEAEMVIYSIKDSGVGFNPDYTHKLFGVFQRLHKADEFEGTGVGLAIVQRIIQRHGGRAWAEGKIGQGATFYFSLPVKGVRE